MMLNVKKDGKSNAVLAEEVSPVDAVDQCIYFVYNVCLDKFVWLDIIMMGPTMQC